MRSTPDPLGALLPDCVPPVRAVPPASRRCASIVAPTISRCDTTDLSPRAKKARWSPKSHTDAEIAEARRILTHWNGVFRGVDGGTLAQVNNMSNVRHYIRTKRRCRDEGDVFAHISERTIIAAIDAYRTATYNVKNHVWKSFADWLDPETILKYAGQNNVARHQLTHAATEKKKLTALQSQAKTVLDHKAFVLFFMDITVKAVPLAIWLYRNTRNTPAVEHFLELVRATKAYRDGLDGPSRGALLQRARAVFDAYFDRPPKTDADRGIMEGLEFALLDLDAAGRTRGSKKEAT